MIYLTVAEAAQLKGCSQQYIQRMALDGSLSAAETDNGNNRKKYLIPITEFSQQEQLRYYKSHGKEIPDELLPKRKPKAVRPHKELDEFTTNQREEIALWIGILKAWDEYCAKSKLQKVPATEKFVQLQQKLFATYTGGNVLEKPERLKSVLKSDSVPTDEEFTKAVEDILTYYFNERAYSGAVSKDSGKTRMRVFQENLHEKRVASEADLNLLLMRSTRSQKVGRRGVHVKIAGESIDYICDELKTLYFDKSVYCRYDPENMATVRVYDLDDNYLMTVPAENEAILEYGASKDEIARAMKKTRSFEKLTREQLKATAVTSLGKKTALELVLAAAEENKANAHELQPKVVKLFSANEDMKLAVGQTEVVTIDKAKMIRNVEKRLEE